MKALARKSLLTLATVALLAGTAACTNVDTPPASGGGASGSQAPGAGVGGRAPADAVKPDPAVQALVPADLKAKGTMQVVTDPTYAPLEYTNDQGNIIGLEPDLATAVANKMGLKVNFNKGDWNGILAGIEAKRYDAAWSAFAVTAAREARVDQISYLKGGTSIMVKHGNPDKLNTVLDLCGTTTAAVTGTTQALTVLPDFQKQCADAGKPAITTLILPSQDNVNQAVSTGRAAAMLADKSFIAYYSQMQPDVFSSVDGILVSPSLVGVVVNKSNTGLASAVEKALNSLIADGTYAKILKAWALDGTAVDAAQLNPVK